MQVRNAQFLLGTPGFVAGVLLFSGNAVQAATYTVTNTLDSGTGSLRKAIQDANTVPGSKIKFNLPPAAGSGGVWTIKPVTALPAVQAPGTIIDGTTQTTFGGDTNPKGPEIVLRGPRGTMVGLRIETKECSVRGLSIQRFGVGVKITGEAAHHNNVQGSYIGLNTTGELDEANTVGIQIDSGAYNNVVGGLSEGQPNVISGNGTDGVRITGVGSKKNVVLGNRIGTSADGLSAIPNYYGVRLMESAQNNFVGSAWINGGNIIAGNKTNVCLTGLETKLNYVYANKIGLNAANEALTGQVFGVLMQDGARENMVGGKNASRIVINFQRNFIGGCLVGVAMLNRFTSKNIVAANYIGVAPDGKSARPNTTGVKVDMGASYQVIGGPDGDAGNVISGNLGSGVLIAGKEENGITSYNKVQGNLIGVGADGVTAVPNGDGISLSNGSHSTTIGGDLGTPSELGAGNLISGNTKRGILIHGADTSYHEVMGNFIGVDAKGAPLPNGGAGVHISGDASINSIGRVDPDTEYQDVDCDAGACHQGPAKRANVIANNGGDGVLVTGNSVTNPIRGNAIRDNKGLGINLQPTGEGIHEVTPNDMPDQASGPNLSRNFPVLTNGIVSDETFVVIGTLDSKPNTTYTVDFYASDTPDASGNGEGALYLGTRKNLVTDAAGHIGFSFKTKGSFAGKFISATATDPDFNTSEFSNTVQSPKIEVFLSKLAVTTENVGAAAGKLEFKVQLSRKSSRTVKVHYVTEEGTASELPETPATKDEDFPALANDFYMAPLVSSANIYVHTLIDTKKEPQEAFFVTLKDTEDVTVHVNDGRGVGIIYDDDNPRPLNVSLSPLNVTDGPKVTRNFTAVYSDADGVGDITKAHFRVEWPYDVSGNKDVFLCYYDAVANKLWVRNDDDTAWLGGFAPGAANNISNGLGVLKCQTTTVLKNGNDLTVMWSVQAQHALAGDILPLSLYVEDTIGGSDGYGIFTSWHISGNQAPVNVSVTPGSATNTVNQWRTFAATYSDINTWRNLRQVYLKVAPAGAGDANALIVRYDLRTNELSLLDDAGATFSIGEVLGDSALLSNTQGSLDCGATTVLKSGNNVTVNWVVRANAGFTGTKDVSLYSVDRGNLSDGYEKMGTWTIGAAGALMSQMNTTSVVRPVSAGFSSGDAAVYTGILTLNFGQNLASTAAEDLSRFQVLVNGEAVDVEAARSGGGRLRLLVPAGALQPGDEVTVQWFHLPTWDGAELTGETHLTAR